MKKTIKPITLTINQRDKEFLRFQEGKIEEGNKLDNLMNYLTGGAFLLSTSIVTFFGSTSTDVRFLYLLYSAWAFLIISFLATVVSHHLSINYHKEYSTLINDKNDSETIVITSSELESIYKIAHRVEIWDQFKIFFWIFAIIVLMIFIYLNLF